MNTYKAIVDTGSSDPRFKDWEIGLKVGAPVHVNTILSWIEELRDDASEKEVSWYRGVVKNNVRVSE